MKIELLGIHHAEPVAMFSMSVETKKPPRLVRWNMRSFLLRSVKNSHAIYDEVACFDIPEHWRAL